MSSEDDGSSTSLRRSLITRDRPVPATLRNLRRLASRETAGGRPTQPGKMGAATKGVRNATAAA